MINIIFTTILISLFFYLGFFTQGLKKLVGLLTKLFLKVLNFFGIKIYQKEKCLKLSDEFKDTYKGITKVKLSKKNLKEISSIDWMSFGILCFAGLLVFINMGFVSNNAISNWLWEILPVKIIKTATDMKTLYTATLFSVLSFSVSKLMSRWKQTKTNRQEKRDIKIKERAIKLMSSKEMLDNARKKDKENYERLKDNKEE